MDTKKQEEKKLDGAFVSGMAPVKEALDLAETSMPEPIAMSESGDRLVHPRTGVEQFAPPLVDLIQRTGTVVPGRDADTIGVLLAEAATLLQVKQQLDRLQQRVADTMNRKRADAWDTFIAFYRVLQAMAVQDEAIAKDLEPIVQFMAIGKRKGENADGETPATTPESPTNGVTPIPTTAPTMVPKIVNG